MSTSWSLLAITWCILCAAIRGAKEEDGFGDEAHVDDLVENTTAADVANRKGSLEEYVEIVDRPISVLQACRAEGKRICGDKRVYDKVPLECFTKFRDLVTDETCARWLDDRDACYEDLKRSNPRDCRNPTRGCFYSANPKSVSQRCIETDFYKGLRMYLAWGRKQVALLAQAKRTVERKPTDLAPFPPQD